VRALRAFYETVICDAGNWKLLADERVRFLVLRPDSQGEKESYFFG